MADRIGEDFQNQTKYHRETMKGMHLDFEKKPETFKRYPGAETVELPLPMDVPAKGLWPALAERRSVRQYAHGSMTLMQLSQLLWAAQGVTARKGPYLLRTAPSAGALYPVETYVVVNNVVDSSTKEEEEEEEAPSPVSSPPEGRGSKEEEKEAASPPSPRPSPPVVGRGSKEEKKEETSPPSPVSSPPGGGRGSEEEGANSSAFAWPEDEEEPKGKRVPPGVYHYDVENHRLELVKAGDFRRDVAAAALDQVMCVAAPVVFAWTAVFERSKWKYAQRAYRYVYLDAGHIAGNVALAAVALGLGTCQIAALFDDEVNALLGVDGTDESAIYMTAAGHPRA